MLPKRKLPYLVFILALVLGGVVLLRKTQVSFSINAFPRQTRVSNAERTTGSAVAKNTSNCEAKDSTSTNNVTPTSIDQDVDISRWRQRLHSLRGESRQFIFLKTHKTGGSTVRNINLRFAITRGLDAMFPKNVRDSLAESSSWVHPSSLIPHPKNLKFDILTDHIIFNLSFLNRIYPPHVPKFTILREPMKQAISGLRYSTINFPTPMLKKGFKKYPDDPINAFLRNPYDFCVFNSPGTVNNRQSVDLGFKLGSDRTKLDAMKKNQTLLNAFAKQLDSGFDLVMILERFDESMLLLRRLLNWSMKEIMYLKVKEVKSSGVWDKKPIIDDKIRKDFREFAAIDYALYDYFKLKLDKIIKSEPLIEEELQSYRNVLEQLKTYCASKSKEDLIIHPSRWTGHGFNITPEDCHLMTNELDTESLAYDKQMERHKLKIAFNDA